MLLCHLLVVEVIAELPAEELAARLGVPVEVVPALRGAHDLNEASALARSILEPPAVSLPEERDTLVRFGELRAGGDDVLDTAAAKSIVRELKAVGGNLKALRVALTGADRGPELWAVVAALPRDEALRRALP